MYCCWNFPYVQAYCIAIMGLKLSICSWLAACIAIMGELPESIKQVFKIEFSFGRADEVTRTNSLNSIYSNATSLLLEYLFINVKYLMYRARFLLGCHFCYSFITKTYLKVKVFVSIFDYCTIFTLFPHFDAPIFNFQKERFNSTSFAPYNCRLLLGRFYWNLKLQVTKITQIKVKQCYYLIPFYQYYH